MELFNETNKAIFEYVTFFLIYVYSFVYLSFKKTEISSIYMLFVVQFVFIFYTFLKSRNYLKFDLFFHSKIIVSSVNIINIFLLVSLSMFLRLLTHLDAKFKKIKNEPIDLPKKYREEFNLYKKLFISTFVLTFVTIIGLSTIFPLINKEFEFINIKSLTNINNLIPVFFICTSLASLGMSSFMIYQGSEFLKLSRRQIID